MSTFVALLVGCVLVLVLLVGWADRVGEPVRFTPATVGPAQPYEFEEDD